MNLTAILPPDEQDWLSKQLQQHNKNSAGTISQFFDARYMACPMPLLKAKITLKSMASQEILYLLASDKNSQTDLVAFCQKNQMAVQTWHSQEPESCYHFLIQKS